MNSRFLVITFYLGIIIYYACKGWTEADGWKHREDSDNSGKKDKHWFFHSLRTGEVVGIILTQLLALGILKWRLFIVHLFGLSIYQMIYSWHLYKNPFYNKVSKWLFIKHPKGYVWGIIFVVSIIILMIKGV
jgi:hypothetical protein